MANYYFTLRYVVVLCHLLFHIKLYCCDKLNLYFTSNFVDVIEVNNWVARKFGKFALFFFFISFLTFLSLTHAYPPTPPPPPLFFLSSQFPSFSHRHLSSSFFFSSQISLTPTSIFLFLLISISLPLSLSLSLSINYKYLSQILVSLS